MINKELFDNEYSTQKRSEVDFLKSVNIRYTFVKRVNGISVYKYKKCGELFRQLSIFYEQEELNRSDENAVRREYG